METCIANFINPDCLNIMLGNSGDKIKRRREQTVCWNKVVRSRRYVLCEIKAKTDVTMNVVALRQRQVIKRRGCRCCLWKDGKESPNADRVGVATCVTSFQTGSGRITQPRFIRLQEETFKSYWGTPVRSQMFTSHSHKLLCCT